ncbi:DrrB family ABC transporter efflux protein [Corynebacterium pyruviciproducens ATCC BAA-1742]|uniref:Transport permease protein n=1 Tax=Corynebacterium pyruviciproducens ATCC BAA-1742 TaxID=1125779 RepID=S2Z3D3_9CORY|nr:ABC transporter permease [Corynebacterium pyruviciproducens]EPD70936.1 DrrB family ABC transporter efflux protein [Corynebacterium pyruviciproducens ATCC BAA-1742]
MRATLATIIRITGQLRHDPRTVALILVVPALLITLHYYVFVDLPVPPGGTPVFDRLGPIMVVVLPMVLMFIVTSVVMLRERTTGTLERVFTTPATTLSLVSAYAIVFGVLALIQSCILTGLVLYPFGATIAGSALVLLLLSFLCALIGIACGLLASAFAQNELQAVQFMPVFVAPQLFLCGLFVPVEHIPAVLEACAHVLPMTWAVDVVVEVLGSDSLGSGSGVRLAGLAAVALAALVLAPVTMRRATD